MMKKLWNDISSNIRQLLEILSLIVITVIPLCVDTQSLFKDYLDTNTLSPDNFVWYSAVSRGKYAVSIILLFLLLWGIRKFNQDFLMNQKNVYHNYCYGWYWFCAKILGIKKCNMILVPIFMQFKLIIRGTFDEYPLYETEYPIIENEPDCKVEITNEDVRKEEINIVLEDTYPINHSQLPKVKQGLLTIKISRNDGSNGRHFSQTFIESTINEIRKIKAPRVVNVFATTNPMNTVHIAKRAFALGERGNIKQLYVFQQKSSGRRRFEDKGRKIY